MTNPDEQPTPTPAQQPATDWPEAKTSLKELFGHTNPTPKEEAPAGWSGPIVAIHFAPELLGAEVAPEKRASPSQEAKPDPSKPDPSKLDAAIESQGVAVAAPFTPSIAAFVPTSMVITPEDTVNTVAVNTVAAALPIAIPVPTLPPMSTGTGSLPAITIPIPSSTSVVTAVVANTPANTPATLSAKQQMPTSGGVLDDLEEQTYTPNVLAQGPQVGHIISGYTLIQDHGRSWFTAQSVEDGSLREVFVKHDPLWAYVSRHRLLPSNTKVGDLRVLEPVEGEPLQAPLLAPQALNHLTDLARLLFALEKQGYSLTDIDPESPRMMPDGLKLRYPPKVALTDEESEPTLRDGYTPPELRDGGNPQPETGVYVLGALLYHWLTGRDLPVEGASSPLVLSEVRVAGMPQLLEKMLSPLPQRLNPTELLEAIKTLTTVGLPAYQIAASISIGLNPDRPINEDSYGFNWRQVATHGGPELMLRACVSDGMGGMSAGEVASKAAVHGFLNSTKPTITEQIWDANANVLTAMQGQDGGCTISAVEIKGHLMQLGHVGDCRVYLSDGPEVQQISKDHSYVAALVANGQLTPEEAQHSPDRNKVLRSLGNLRQPQDNYVQTLAEPVELDVGQRVLLVSDGVWGEIEPPIIFGLMINEPDLQVLADKLIDLALEAGAPDNATVLVIQRTK